MPLKALNTSQDSSGGWAGILVGMGLMLLALWFLWGPDLSDIPETKAAAVHPSQLTTDPRRKPLADPPVIPIGGFNRTCMDCHKLFPAREAPPKKLYQHEHVVMDHGINDRCRNCHDVNDRDRLVLQSGESIPYSKVVLLCSNCHGPTYRDWERGMHGRTNGYWNTIRGARIRLGCTECHDPHKPRSPAMDPLKPLPPPNTLRLAMPKEHGHSGAKESDPLREVIRRSEQEWLKSHDEKEF